MRTKEAAKKRVITTRKDTKAHKKSSTLKIITHCEALGIDSKILSSCLAVNPKTIQRWREGIAEPGESASRSLEKLETVYQLAARLLGKDSWKDWFLSPNHTLGEESPVDLLSRGEVDQVKNVLGMLEWGIYS
ncbi:MAG TPA: MbcA/ParS/Xre antitoxin family protein [Nitrospirota bacterium]|nr:MbcA/ParS/Xre antitoxin family protein [Nitrospirota bacterium]